MRGISTHTQALLVDRDQFHNSLSKKLRMDDITLPLREEKRLRFFCHKLRLRGLY